MPHHHMPAIAIVLPADLFNDAVARRKDFRSRRCAEIHAVMKLPHLVNGVDSVAVTTCHSLQVLVPNRLDGRDGQEHFLLLLRQIQYLIKRPAL